MKGWILDMNKYETVVIMDSKITDEERNQAINKIYTYISDNGKITNKEELGLKRLAYEVKKQKEAFYYVIYFEMKPENIVELEKRYRIADEVLKFIVVKKD